MAYEGEVSGQGVRMLRFGSQIRIRSGGVAARRDVEAELAVIFGISNQNPSRIESEAVSLVNMKCQPGGRSLMPRKRAEVVNVRRSMPQRIPGGRLRRRMEGVRLRVGFEEGVVGGILGLFFYEGGGGVGI